MTEERRWKIQELTTEGWTSIDPSTDSLIKADCTVAVSYTHLTLPTTPYV